VPFPVPAVRSLSLTTKLLLMMLSLLVLSVFSLFVLHLTAVRQLLAQVGDYTDELSTAIEIAQEQPRAEGDLQAVVTAYADKLRQLGVKDVSIADASEEVQASTNPKQVGKRLVRKKKGPREYVIRGILGDEAGPSGSQKTSTLTIPIIVGDRRVGYVLITRILDDFSALSTDALVSRLMATMAVFAFGILVSLYLAWSFSRPLQRLTQAAGQVAAGDLSIELPARGGDEIGSLTRTFNEMVRRLRESRRLEERLHSAERTTALGRLASALAHEIRNPLNFINLSIDHVRGRFAPEAPERREEFGRIMEGLKSEISRLNRLVADFLSVGRPVRLDRRPCSIEGILRDVAALVDPKARDQGISLVMEAEEGLPEVVADPELLKTCFLNLMINASDAMPEGGLLRVRVRREPEAGGDTLAVTVTDTGHGMTLDAVEAAFEPYYSTKETGVGLGLALTRKIVEDHGGSIGLASSPGLGTTARIALPVAASTAPLPAVAVP
jgi:signal transduction histidine kinase